MNEATTGDLLDVLTDILDVLLTINDKLGPNEEGAQVFETVSPTVRTYASPSLAQANDSEGIV